ncbi:hypothetical protein SAMN02745194_04578 [Roseomonas rosea]|uniref:Uncharacterized protein n=1 Tax=Muricoccus roseus TaxID=198092 RepID=A0A1M6R2Y7_9PROT|nr:hypothetical protein [Roseomonas rosea]SHK26814.1 hypothetical protein SAMN02745194_04578 [Roseomonas rosea]
MSDSSNPAAAASGNPVKRRPGRPAGGDMAQLTLRIPRAHLLALMEESARRSVETGRNVTPQAIIAGMIAAGLATKSENAPAE